MKERTLQVVRMIIGGTLLVFCIFAMWDFVITPKVFLFDWQGVTYQATIDGFSLEIALPLGLAMLLLGLNSSLGQTLTTFVVWLGGLLGYYPFARYALYGKGIFDEMYYLTVEALWTSLVLLSGITIGFSLIGLLRALLSKEITAETEAVMEA